MDSQGQRTEPDVPPAAPGAESRSAAPAAPVAGTQPAEAAATAPGVATAAATAAASGLAYGDVTSRFIAIVVDGILVGIVSGTLQVVAGLVFGPAVRLTSAGDLVGDINYATVLIGAIIGIVVSFAYFSLLWTTQGSTLGMRVLGLQVGTETDGATIAPNQAAIRWVALFGPFALAQAFWPLPVVGQVIGLASLAWAVLLLVTTAQSPTKQGLHDRSAHTVVLKVVRRTA